VRVLGGGSLASCLRLVLDLVLITLVVLGVLNALLLLGLLVDPARPARHLLHITTLYEVPAGALDAGTLVRSREPGALVETRLLAFVNYRPGGRAAVAGVAVGVFIIWGLYLVIAQQLRRVFDSLASGEPFLRSNVARLRSIGWALVAATLWRFAWAWTAVAAMRSVVTVAERRPTLPLAFVLDDLRPEGLFVGAAVLVLAEIFRAGAGLREDQALTV
jgi:hypothetical protein